jgi:flagellar hook-length control protein FliK
MISNVAVKSTEAAGSAAPAAGEPVDTGDTGAFDALLALQSLAGEDTVTDLTAQLAGALEGVELPGTPDDSDDFSADDAELSPGDALSFLAALLPLPQKPAAADVAAGTSAAAAAPQDAVSAGAAGAAGATSAGNAAPPTGSNAGTSADLLQAFASNLTDASGTDSKPAAVNATATPAIDTTTWNSMTGPAEMFAHGPRHAPERVESATLPTHVRDPRWADDLGNRLASMVRTGESSASLQLTPVDLGPLEVNVAVRDNQATVHFGAANAETRALLEASIPRLREMLASQGFSLMDSSVSHGFARQTRHESAGTPRVNAIGESPTASAARTHIIGLLDTYA